MTKKEAIERFVSQDLSGIPQDWVKKVIDAGNEYHSLPMWGTMWICNFPGADDLFEHSRMMYRDKDELKEAIEREAMDEGEHKRIKDAIEKDDWSVLEEYIDEEMAGEHCVLDKDGDTTAIYIYDIEGHWVIGVNGAGWNFYDGVWDKLYDAIGLQWHDDEPKKD